MSRPPDARRRCGWPGNPLAIAYHDKEWGVPVRDDRKLFEFLILEGAQAGLSWDTILAKRENYRTALHGFDFQRISRYTAKDKKRLLANPGIVRNRAKIDATIVNARAVIALREEFGSFSRYLWRFVDGKPLQGRRRGRGDVPARTEVSDALSKDLKKRGFKFVGTTIMYAFMQAVGMVNDHQMSCFCWRKLNAKR
jgi:DNA-3-methyladenine glycosylase I